ncbi:mitochondrial escape protein 2 [Orbilia brochopaga]|uniref:Mitochondrial escape protein 2 n=1 Tax=Orbilia brochopaga TaxID=3140254 RepID=A0AAV9UIU1_9PEZI
MLLSRSISALHRRQCLVRNFPAPSRRPLGRICRIQPPRRHVTTAVPSAGETVHIEPTKLLSGVPRTGFMDLGPNEGLLYFDNVYPMVSAYIDAKFILTRLDQLSVAERILRYSLPKDFPVEIKQVIPRIKDGGAFVKFVHPPDMSPREVEQQMHDITRKSDHPWYNPFGKMNCYLVEGQPWLEDLYRFPASRLKVEFNGPDVEAEELYSTFRRFGRLVDIIPQPKDSKELPRYAYLQFLKIRSAAAAKNCLHDVKVRNNEGKLTHLRILYAPVIKGHAIRKWIIDHPRIVLPIVAAILAAIAVSVFDPIRTWFVKAHITRSFDVGSKAWTWFKEKTSSYLVLKQKPKDDAAGDLSVLWEERKGNVDTMKAWLLESAETFIVVQGPRGSGKRELVIGNVLKDWKNKLVFDCEPVQERPGDAHIIRAAAAQVGYRPVFSWLNSLSSWADIAIQGTIGATAGLSENLETQFSKILQNTATALKRVALSERTNSDKDAALNDDEWLEAHPEKRPVIVIDNFLHRSDAVGDMIYQRLADWAAVLVSANVAHVIFMTNDVSFSKQLAKSLPDRVFRTVMLGDASPEAAKKYVLSHIHSGMTENEKTKEIEELDSSIDQLGGRLTDLEFLARRIRSGETPTQAVSEIIKTSANEILKLHFLGDPSRRNYSPEQAWALIKMFGDNEQLRYNEVLLHGLFSKGGKEALQALEQAELISIVSAEGRPWAIKPGKPVYRAAFKKLQDDKVLQATLDINVATELTKIETANVAKYEAELTTLGQLPSRPSEIAGRVSWLLKKLQASQAKVEQYEKEMGALKKVLQSEW